MTQLVIANHRIHHGVLGLGLVVLGAALAFHDRRDRSVWLCDLLRS